MAELTEQKQQQRAMWAMGDYPSAAEQIVDVGRSCVKAAGVSAGDAVLDVACGAGNATIPAAQAGAEATGLDITPELLEAARSAAADAGVEIAWVEGDAEQLPFEDASFDAVLSVFGCMFAPDQRASAAELARVLKPGGRLAVCAWTPEGQIGKFFMTVAKHMPPPPEGFQPPLLWGNEDHVRQLFDGTGVELEFDRETVDFTGGSPEAFLADFEQKLPPMVNAKRVLEPEGKWQPLRDELAGLYDTENEAGDGTYRSAGEYLVIKGRKAG